MAGGLLVLRVDDKVGIDAGAAELGGVGLELSRDAADEETGCKVARTCVVHPDGGSHISCETGDVVLLDTSQGGGFEAGGVSGAEYCGFLV